MNNYEKYTTHKNIIQGAKLKSVKPFYKGDEGYDEESQAYCEVVFENTDEMGNVWELKIPKVLLSSLDINLNQEYSSYLTMREYRCTLKINNNEYTLSKGNINEKDNVFYQIKLIKEAPPIELTLDEVEEKFGRKVRIVNEKSETKN